jgi:hypothetical protein
MLYTPEAQPQTEKAQQITREGKGPTAEQEINLCPHVL